MNPTLIEVIEYLESWDCKPTKENIKKTLERWIQNLYSHIGIAAHKYEQELGIVDETGMTWEEQDLLHFQQIDRYKKCLMEIG